MKKIILTAVCLIAFSAHAFDEAACLAANGEIRIGEDKKSSYCFSSQLMNWWSAFGWCQSVGGELIDYTKECFLHSGNTKCPNFYSGKSGGWTRNPANAEKAYVANGNGDVPAVERKKLYQAICK